MTKILIIEDESLLREEILDTLTMQGFEALDAENGSQGLHLAQTQPPDLIICDVTMPEMDGHQVLTALRQRPETALIPFIFLTAKGSKKDVRQGMNLGADDYLTKPFSVDELLEAVDARLTKQSTVRQVYNNVQDLQHSNLLKDEFLGKVSQELKGPVTNIMMALRLLKQASNPEQVKRYIDKLQQECSRESDLIDDLLELHYIETNQRPLNIEQIELQKWAATVVNPFRGRAQKRQQSLWANIPPYLPQLTLDVGDLNRILSELLDNACKFTRPGGKIVLEGHCPLASINASEVSHQMVSISVSNEAEMPAKFIPSLCQPFYRAPEMDRWQQGGNGLGLAIVEKLIKRIGGTFNISSNSGWTQCMVQLPAVPANSENPSPTLSAEL